jgi:hypothetical protein
MFTLQNRLVLTANPTFGPDTQRTVRWQLLVGLPPMLRAHEGGAMRSHPV